MAIIECAGACADPGMTPASPPRTKFRKGRLVAKPDGSLHRACETCGHTVQAAPATDMHKLWLVS